MARTAAINVRVEPAVKHAIEKAAAAQGRGVANLIERLTVEWLTVHGYIKSG
jgi:hypothetical protein